MLKLHTYFRSSAAFRVRIALNLKALEYTAVPVHLLRGGGQQHEPAYVELNPTALLPTLEDGALTVAQSLAIIEYLDETHRAPPLLPADAPGRARVRALALSIACDIHPLNNLRVLRYLKATLDIDEQRRDEWYRHWVTIGFTALERMLAAGSATGPYCHGAAPTMADCCLVPQVFNAKRMHCALDDYPVLMRIHDNCMALDAFRRATPELQPDAE
jgi:maleylacetoacetate isomerase